VNKCPRARPRDNNPAMPEHPTTPDPAVLVQRGVEASSAGEIHVLVSFFAPDATYDVVGMGVFKGRPSCSTRAAGLQTQERAGGPRPTWSTYTTR
jgi:hypothetical protein